MSYKKSPMKIASIIISCLVLASCGNSDDELGQISSEPALTDTQDITPIAVPTPTPSGDIDNQDIKLKIIGKKNFSKELNRLLTFSEKKTSKNKSLQINLALNYGSKSELINAIKLIIKDNEKISERSISKYLQTKNIPDPEILIRTGNTKRLSNFLLWQVAYSEIFFEKKLWPDFNEKDYLKIIEEYKYIKRKFGNI